MPGKNLILKLNAKMLPANEEAEFLNFISKTIRDRKLIFACRYISVKVAN